MTNATETGLSDCHKLTQHLWNLIFLVLNRKMSIMVVIGTLMKKNFSQWRKGEDFSFKTSNPAENYSIPTNVFSNIFKIHAPLKMKILRGNDSPFMNKELRKAIYTRSRLRNRYFKNPTKENETPYKKQRNKCVWLRRKSIVSRNIFLR